MKRQKILIDVYQARAETTPGSTELNDRIDLIKARYLITETRLRQVCLLAGGEARYW